MTEGTRTEDIQDQTPASTEVVEARSALDKATLEPVEALEKGDFQQDEEIQEAFTAAVPPAENAQAFESPLLITSLDGKTNDPGNHYSEVEMAQGEVLNDSDLNTQSVTSPEGSAEFIMDNKEELDGDEGGSASEDNHSGVNQIPGEVAQDSDWNEAQDFAREMADSEPGEVRGYDDGTERTTYLIETTDGNSEGIENQVIIPPENSLIDFAGAVSELTKVDSFTSKLGVAKDETGDFRTPSLHKAEIDPLPERTASGDDQETVGNAADLEVTQSEDPPAYDLDLKPEQAGIDEKNQDSHQVRANRNFNNYSRLSESADSLERFQDPVTGEKSQLTPTQQKSLKSFDNFIDTLESSNADLEKTSENSDQSNTSEAIAGLKSEIITFQDELDDWPEDGSSRTITYTEWVKNADGSFSPQEVTKTMTKDEVKSQAASMQNQIETIEDSLDEGNEESVESPPLGEGRIMVGDANLTGLSGLTSEQLAALQPLSSNITTGSSEDDEDSSPGSMSENMFDSSSSSPTGG